MRYTTNEDERPLRKKKKKIRLTAKGFINTILGIFVIFIISFVLTYALMNNNPTDGNIDELKKENQELKDQIEELEAEIESFEEEVAELEDLEEYEDIEITAGTADGADDMSYTPSYGSYYDSSSSSQDDDSSSSSSYGSSSSSSTSSSTTSSANSGSSSASTSTSGSSVSDAPVDIY